MLPFELTKDTPYLALSGELWSVFYEYFNRNWSCYKGFLLYFIHSQSVASSAIQHHRSGLSHAAKPLTEQMVTCHQLDTQEQTSVKFELKFKSFLSRKCLQNGIHFVENLNITNIMRPHPSTIFDSISAVILCYGWWYPYMCYILRWLLVYQ